ncbi:MAG: hypothetical protein HOJ99_04370 [Porticoccaceae bacterium]|jgi:hypothetical protein|nr:hypothetical protein [Porticoccaceae bacterium]
MNIVKLIAAVVVLALSPVVFGQDLKLGESFVGDFTVDSVSTTDGVNYHLTASGDAGPYGRVYGNWLFTNKLGLEDMGEFTGYGWTQSGEDVVTATLQGVWKKNGTVFDLYTFDAVSNGLINVATGKLDLVNKTLRFNVAPVQN